MNIPRNVKFIVIQLNEGASYDYLIPLNGETKALNTLGTNCKAMHSEDDESIEVAYIGSLDKLGNLKDTLTRRQENSLFDLIVKLSERYPLASVVGNCKCRRPPSSRSFDVKSWLANYQPDF